MHGLRQLGRRVSGILDQGFNLADGDTLIEQADNALNAFDVFPGVKTVTFCRPLRADQAIAALPGTQRYRVHPRQAGYGAYRIEARGPRDGSTGARIFHYCRTPWRTSLVSV
jgi:hypothetical protein